MVSRQPSASNLHSFYTEPPPSPKSPVFGKGHSRRPSFTAWLARGSSQPPASPATKVMQISDPQPINPQDAAAKAPGALGKGAAVVRTPHQALGIGFPPSETPNEKDELEVVDIKPLAPSETLPPTQPLVPAVNRRESPVPRRESPVPRRIESPAPMHDFPTSVRASPIPSGIRSLHTSKSFSHLQSSPRGVTSSLPPRNAPLPLNLVSSSRQPLLRSALRPPSPTKPTSGSFLPLLPPPRQSPKETPPASPLPPFHPVLLSGVPNHPVPPSQVIVTLETSTLSQRTTVATLTSRPSRLASYLQALVPSASKDSPSVESSFSSLFAAHLAQAGLVPQIQASHSGPIHIFLDRPSSPYAHILTYLRSGAGATGVLPRSASLALSTDPARVEALCELRDEARYLELSELAELCDKELRARAPKLRSTASSSSLRDLNFGSGSEGSGGRTGSGEGFEARLREYRFGEPLKEEAEGEDGEEGAPMQDQIPPVVYEKRGSHAGMVVTVPPRGLQLTGMKVGHGRTTSARIPSALSGRVRTMSDVRYTHAHEQKTWI
ncbi:hypothetical protein FRC08_015287 [Ceratobasidium sp. 394]|nr:hypothetical protein FRC08_015287 [Ceratobasidium sp. 394]